MTKAELIEALKDCDDNAQIIIKDIDTGNNKTKVVSVHDTYSNDYIIIEVEN